MLAVVGLVKRRPFKKSREEKREVIKREMINEEGNIEKKAQKKEKVIVTRDGG
jgi:hypothetical protein